MLEYPGARDSGELFRARPEEEGGSSGFETCGESYREKAA